MSTDPRIGISSKIFLFAVIYMTLTVVAVSPLLSPPATPAEKTATWARDRLPTITSASPAGTPGSLWQLLAEFDFDDDLGNPDPQGWVSADLTAQVDTFFHVDDFNGLSAPYTPLKGNQSMWCGARDLPDVDCRYALPGYGSSWRQSFESIPFTTSGDVTVSFLVQYDTEPGYDFTYVEYLSVSDRWNELLRFDGLGSANEAVLIPADSLAGTAQIRFRFESDPSFDDQDGNFPTDGAIIIDSLVVSDAGGVVDYQDFEAESVGDLSTMDGHWRATVPPPFGDYAGLFDGTTVLQEDPLLTNTTYMWGFFNGSTDDYSCGGHPEQPVVPFTPNPGSTDPNDYIANGIVSPPIDFTLLSAQTDSFRLEFDVYQDLPTNNLVFYSFSWRFLVGGEWTCWLADHNVHPGDASWYHISHDAEVPSSATHVGVRLEVIDMCHAWCGSIGDGLCHSHGPLFDNVSVYLRSNCPVSGILYVDADATGLGNGFSWANAFTELSDALAWVDSSACVVSEIWVAEGTYKPTAGVDRSATFQLIDGVAIYGGFAGTEATREARDWLANVTILSGDIGVEADSTDNCYHVVTGSGTNATAILDGFIITRGTANGSGDDGKGGGMVVDSGTPTLSNLVFTGNSASQTAGVGKGGGLYFNGNVTLTNARFDGNTARDGGGMYIDWTSENAVLSDLEFTNNSAGAYGGGVYIWVANVTMTNVQFIGNQAGLTGGGLDCHNNCDATIINAVFRGNSAGSGGGLSNLTDSNPHLVNVTMTENTAYYSGGGIAGDHRVTLTSTIMWGDSAQIEDNEIYYGQANISYSLIEGCGGSGPGWNPLAGRDDGNNIDADPLFVDATNGDLRLLPGSPAIDAGDNSTPNLPATDLDGNPRIIGDFVDMGAYEHDTQTAIIEPPSEMAPVSFVLHQNIPNPFNPSTAIRYDVPVSGGKVTLRVYDVDGRLVCTLVNEHQAPGQKITTWYGRNSQGQRVAAGVYFYRMTAPGFEMTKKMILLK